MKDETKRMLRRVQMYIDEDPGNRLLNNYNYFNINSRCNLSVPLLLFRQLRSTILNAIIIYVTIILLYIVYNIVYYYRKSKI